LISFNLKHTDVTAEDDDDEESEENSPLVLKVKRLSDKVPLRRDEPV